MVKKFDTFIFDLDGTLLDTLPDLVILTNKVLGDNGFPLRSQEEILSYVGKGAKALICRAVPEGTPPETAEVIMKNWKDSYAEYGTRLTKPYPGTSSLISNLSEKKKNLAVLSNKFEKGTLQLVNTYFPNLFDIVHGESKTIPRKPDPRGLQCTIEELRSVPAQVLYIGDSPGDILTAQRAGVCAMGVTWGYNSKAVLEKAAPDYLVDKPEEILEFMD